MKIILTERQLKYIITENSEEALIKVNDAKQKVRKIAEKVDGLGLGSPVSKFLTRVAAVESCYGLNKEAGKNYWQVDPIAFKDTQSEGDHPSLTKKYAILRQNNIDWKKLTYDDIISDPLYNCIAARLYLSNMPGAIGDSLVAQAEYWKDYYNTSAGKGGKEDFINKNSGKGLHNCVGYV